MPKLTQCVYWGFFVLIFLYATPIYAQEESRPQIAAGIVDGSIKVDGVLDEPDWKQAPSSDQFKTIVPEEGGQPSNRTVVRVIAHTRFLAIGIRCFDNDPQAIVNFSKLRDVDLENEDHIRLVIDPFLDGQSGIIFSVNANGARYDALVSNRGEYHFSRYRLEAELAAKRKLNGQLSWWFGSFYGGKLQEYEASINWNPLTILTFECVGTHNIGRLPYGDFEQTLAGVRVRFNASPDLQLNSFVQFDTNSKQLGVNARIHWIFHPQGDVFFVFNHNTLDGLDRWELVNQQVILKLRYNFRL